MRLTYLRALHAFCLNYLHALHSFASYGPYSRALSTCLVRLFQALSTLYLYVLKCYKDRFGVQQKLSIFQEELLKVLKLCCFYVGQNTAMKRFKRGNFLSILKREISSLFLCVFLWLLQTLRNKCFSLK